MTREWNVADWYKVLVGQYQQVIPVDEWFLYRRSDERVEIIRQDGEMCSAIVTDGNCTIESHLVPLPEPVVLEIRELLNLEGKYGT